MDDIVRAWGAVRAELNVDASLRDCLISYSGGRGGVATVHFTVSPPISNEAAGQQVIEPKYYVVNIQGDRIHVFPEGQGEVVNPR